MTRLNLHGAILLQPLSHEQINRYLEGAKLLGLRSAVENDSILCEMAQSPFLLNTMRFTYADLSEQSIGKSETLEMRRNELLTQYVNKRFQQYPNAAYTQLQARHYLTWLADKIVEHQQTVFYIEDMQFTWLETNHQKPAFIVIPTLLVGLFFLLIIPLFFGLSIGPITGLFYGLLIGLLVATGLAWLIWKNEEPISRSIRIHEKVTYNWHEIREGLAVTLKGLLIGPIFGLIGSLLYGLLYGLYLGIGIGLVGMIISGTLFGLLKVLGGIKTSQAVEQRTMPNQGMRLSLRNIYQMGVFGVLSGVLLGAVVYLGFPILVEEALKNSSEATAKALPLTTGTVDNLGTMLLAGVFGGYVGVPTTGGIDLVEHIFLRWLLYRKGRTPMDYAKFLDYIASLSIMRKVGGGYVFIHRMLLEYFAERWEISENIGS